MWDPYGEFKKAVWPNGLAIYASQWKGRPWEAVQVVVHSGGKEDPLGLAGTAHFVEHLVSQNQSISHDEIQTFFRNLGSVELGSTDHFDTAYYFRMPIDAPAFSQAFSIFGNMLLFSKLERRIETERKVIIQEFRRRFPLIIDYEKCLWESRAIFPGLWPENKIRTLGTPESVTRISQKDLQDFYDNHYHPQNISIIGVGGLSLKELEAFLADSPFASVKQGFKNPISPILDSVPAPRESGRTIKLSEFISKEASLNASGYRSVSVIPGTFSRPLLSVVANALDEILLARFRQDRGWAYSIDAGFTDLVGFYRFSINSSNVVVDAIEKSDELVDSCVAELQSREDLFQKHREAGKNRLRMIDLSAQALCKETGRDLSLYHRIISLVEAQREYEKMTFPDMLELLNYLKRERRWTLIIRP